MGRLVYSMLISLDGYVADEHGRFAWATPDDEVLRYVTERFASVTTYLYGRRMYETMVYWETAPTTTDADPSDVAWARLWQAADKVVYSTTLAEPRSERTRVERAFDPDEVRRLKADADGDLTVDGPGLAAHALRAGLVDDVEPIVFPVVVGGGTRFFPEGVPLGLELREARRFEGGAVALRYEVAGATVVAGSAGRAGSA